MRNVPTFSLVLVVLFLALAVLEFIGIQLDLFFNGSWLRPAMEGWRWWNYFTTDHGLTGLYLNGGYWWLVPSLLLALICATAVALSSK